MGRDDEQCLVCIYFRPTKGTYGQCRKESPRANGSPGWYGFWPEVDERKWCGKFEHERRSRSRHDD